MLTYFTNATNQYTLRVEPLPSGSEVLSIDLQDMTTLKDWPTINLSGSGWSYEEYESYVSFGVDFDAETNFETPVGNEFRMTIYPRYRPSGSQSLVVGDVVWRGSLAFFVSQSEDKPNYVNQIPLPETPGDYPYISNDTINRYIILP